jgi:chemotaxis response regulator CheB
MAPDITDWRPSIGQNEDMATTSVLVVDGDDLARRAIGRTVVCNGYELAGEARTAVQALQILAHTAANVVVIGNELQGLRGVDVTAELTQAGKRVILVSADQVVLAQAREAGAFAAIPRGNLATLERVLAGIGREAVEGERRSGVDRRAGEDRRVAQDWSKVIRERRTSNDRRQSDRRHGSAAVSA